MTKLVFLHGFLGHPQEFEFLKSLEKNFDCVSLDLNQGSSFSLKAQAEYVKNKLDQLGIHKAHFWGYSMGGRVCLELYKKFPEICLSLTLESVSLGLVDKNERNERVKKDSEWAELTTKNPKLFLEKWYDQDIFASFKKQKNFPIYISLRKKTLSSLHAQMIVEASPGANADHFDLINNIKVPVLALVGQFDDKYLQIWGKLIDKYPQIAIEIIKNSGHVIHIENPTGAVNAFKKMMMEK
ncbi:MAG: alpha/beta fold hydrolase [Bdellovibrionota bacterium]